MSVPDARSQDAAVHISATRDAQRSVVFHPESNDLFIRTGKQVIEDCQLAISLSVWMDELNSLLREMGDWAAGQSQLLRSCYCSPVRGRLTFFFAPKAEQFDFDLADLLVNLSLSLRQKYNVGSFELLQAPWSDWDRFVNIESAVRIYGDTCQPSGPVAA